MKKRQIKTVNLIIILFGSTALLLYLTHIKHNPRIYNYAIVKEKAFLQIDEIIPKDCFVAEHYTFLDEESATKEILKSNNNYILLGNGWLYNKYGGRNLLKYFISADRKNFYVVNIPVFNKDGEIFIKSAFEEKYVYMCPYLVKNKKALCYIMIDIIIYGNLAKPV